MSMVFNLLVLPTYTPPDVAAKMREGFVDANGRTVCFGDIAQYNGNAPACPAAFWPGKVPECAVWASAINHIDRDGVKNFLWRVWGGNRAPELRLAMYEGTMDMPHWDVGTIDEVLG